MKCLIFSFLIFGLEVNAQSFKLPEEITTEDMKSFQKLVNLGGDWKLQSIDFYTFEKPLLKIKREKLNDTITGKELIIALVVNEKGTLGVSSHGVEIDYCLPEQYACLTWIFVKNKNQDWIIDRTYERFDAH